MSRRLFLNETIFKNKKKGIYIELGALDGILYSNTKFFDGEPIITKTNTSLIINKYDTDLASYYKAH